MASKMELFLFLSNLIVFILVPIDIAYLSGILESNGSYLVLINLIGVATTLIAFRYKRIIKRGKAAKTESKDESKTS